MKKERDFTLGFTVSGKIINSLITAALSGESHLGCTPRWITASCTMSCIPPS